MLLLAVPPLALVTVGVCAPPFAPAAGAVVRRRGCWRAPVVVAVVTVAAC